MQMSLGNKPVLTCDGLDSGGKGVLPHLAAAPSGPAHDSCLKCSEPRSRQWQALQAVQTLLEQLVVAPV